MLGEVTQLLQRFKQGDKAAESQLITVVYGELKRLARSHLRGARRDQTLQPTALVHEAYIKLAGASAIDWQDRDHFFRLASQVMRQVVVDNAREHLAGKRGGQLERIPFVETLPVMSTPPAEVIALSDALDRLGQVDNRAYRIVEMRVFGGFSVAETALALGISERTVKREWRFGRAWLQGELQSGGASHANPVASG